MFGDMWSSWDLSKKELLKSRKIFTIYVGERPYLCLALNSLTSVLRVKMSPDMDISRRQECLCMSRLLPLYHDGKERYGWHKARSEAIFRSATSLLLSSELKEAWQEFGPMCCSGSRFETHE